MKLTILISAVIISLSISDTVTQTDWSGGAGVLGPVKSWSKYFYNYYNTDPFSNPSELTLGGAIQKFTVADGFDEARHVDYADFDNDGDLDVIGVAYGDELVSWWSNDDGIGTSWSEHQLMSGVSMVSSVAAGDIDDDGYIDAVVGGNDQVVWLRNDGNETGWTEYVIETIDANGIYVSTGDIDEDGNLDVLRGSTAGWLCWWRNQDGSGTNWDQKIIRNSYTANCAYAFDIDSDGNMDVLTASNMGSKLTWWENTDGTGDDWTQHTIESYYGAIAADAADIDGDGDLDVACVSHNGSDMGIWINEDGIGTTWT
ncbi:MAG: hypothetical protein GF388_06940, partial [Candidatus Aegiribacteria sp.]|nr:hypothetical protein [Candidatus Aegiribacteria sp.]